jgi:hypothetical protein
MRGWLAVVVALAGCRGGESARAPSPGVPLGSSTVPLSTAASTADPAAGSDPWSGSNADPWAVAPDPTAAPTLMERRTIADAACPKVTAPYFYKLEKGGQTSYILGTRHIGIPLSKFPSEVTTAIDSARLIVFEVAPGDDSSKEKEGIDIPDAVGPELWTRYRALVGDDIAQAMEHESPPTVVIMMSALYEDPTAMLEHDIETEASAKHTPMQGLETAAFQDDVLATLMDVRMLKATISHTKDRKEIETDSRKDISEYCQGKDNDPGMDADERKDLLDDGYTKAELDKMDDTLVFSRNADWIPKLDRLFTRGGVFVAVGADHLRGPRGVIALLSARGYKATRLP